MPRLDNSNHAIIDWYRLEFDETDPSKTPPVDLCDHCFYLLDEELQSYDIEHPSYDDDLYHCFDCGDILAAEDN